MFEAGGKKGWLAALKPQVSTLATNEYSRIVCTNSQSSVPKEICPSCWVCLASSSQDLPPGTWLLEWNPYVQRATVVVVLWCDVTCADVGR